MTIKTGSRIRDPSKDRNGNAGIFGKGDVDDDEECVVFVITRVIEIFSQEPPWLKKPVVGVERMTEKGFNVVQSNLGIELANNQGQVYPTKSGQPDSLPKFIEIDEESVDTQNQGNDCGFQGVSAEMLA